MAFASRRCLLRATVEGALVAWLAILVLATAGAATDAEVDDRLPEKPLAEGQPLFEAKGCAGCHSVFGDPRAPRLGPDLAREGTWADVMQFAGRLWNHMPVMGQQMRERAVERAAIAPEEMGKLATYLFSVKFFDEPGDARRGSEAFARRSCAQCHQLGGRGGTAGPRLDDLKEHVSSFFMAQAMWNHGPGMVAKINERGLVWPRLEDDDIADIVALIRGGSRVPGALELAYAEAGSAASGRALFQQKGCVKCHAVAGAGGAVGPDLAKRRAVARVGKLAAALWNHGPPMWAKMTEMGIPFMKLSDREMADLIAYLHFLQYMGAAGDAARGATLFREKSCARCHAAGGAVAGPGPDLAASPAVQSALRWTSAMWNHAPAMERAFSREQVEWPRFAGDEMGDLVAYLRAQGGAK